MATARTVRELIDGALRIIGAYEVGETSAAADTTRALQVLQDILAEEPGSLMVPYLIQEKIDMVSAQSSYTVGENGSPDLNTQRPEQILSAFIRTSGGYDHFVQVFGEKHYALIPDKDSPGRPENIWYNPTVPNGTIYCYPTPNNSTDDLYINSLKTLSEPTSLTSNLLNTVSIPRNYHNPLKWMLALELCEEYGKTPTVLMVKKDEDARQNIITLNAARMAQPAILEIGATGISMAQRHGSIISF